MDRRKFLTTTLITTAGSMLAPGCEKFPGSRKTGKAQKIENLAGYTLEELRQIYEVDLFDDFLPFMGKYIIDHEYGGFMCYADRDGTLINTDKNSWFEGRGIWVYSFLYNNLKADTKYLEVARKSVEFILQNKPSGDQLWPRFFTREGKPKSAPDKQVYGDLFIAEGLAEYAKATKDWSYWEFAKELVLKCVRIYDRPDYYPEIGKTYLGNSAPLFPGARILGVWMVLIRVISQMLEMRADEELEKLVQRSVDAVLNAHFNPQFQLINELLNHDLSRPDNDYAQLVYTGHAIETLWMILYEAVRRRDRELFDTAAQHFQRHVEVAWDDVYGGVFRNLQHVDKNIWIVDKALWAQEEVLIGALYVVEHTGADWAKEMFSRMYTYVREKFPLQRYGFPLWILYADRKVTFQRHYNRVGNYHHPRHLMLNLLSLERMIKQGGQVSGVFV